MVHMRPQQQMQLHAPSWGTVNCTWRPVADARQQRRAATSAAAHGRQAAVPPRRHLEPVCSPSDPYTAGLIDEPVYTLPAAGDGSSAGAEVPPFVSSDRFVSSEPQLVSRVDAATHQQPSSNSSQPVWLQVYPCSPSSSSNSTGTWTTDQDLGAAHTAEQYEEESRAVGADSKVQCGEVSVAGIKGSIPATSDSRSSSTTATITSSSSSTSSSPAGCVAPQQPVGSYMPQRTAALAALREAQRQLELASTAAAARQRVTYRWRVEQGLLAKAQEGSTFRYARSSPPGQGLPPQAASAPPGADAEGTAPQPVPLPTGVAGGQAVSKAGQGMLPAGGGMVTAASAGGSSLGTESAAADGGSSVHTAAAAAAAAMDSQDGLTDQEAAEEELQDLLQALAPDDTAGAASLLQVTPVRAVAPMNLTPWSSHIAALEQQQQLLGDRVGEEGTPAGRQPAADQTAAPSNSTELTSSPLRVLPSGTSGSPGSPLYSSSGVQVAAWDASWPEYIQGQPDATNSQLMALLPAHNNSQQPGLQGAQPGGWDSTSSSSGGGGGGSSSDLALAPAGLGVSCDPGSLPDPSYGLMLCVFVYCVGAQQLRRLLWSMGLPAGCVAFVARVADADVVLHQRAPRGTKQYQYDMYRKQAKDKGIPFVSLTVVDPQELTRWFLPIFALYAGRISPAALTQRRRPDRWGRRSHANIKL